MRTIKFRVWDTKIDKFFKPDYRAYAGHLEDLHLDLGGGLCLRSLDGFTHCDSMWPDRFIVQQFTGLKDKNGKEIYEGDVVWISRFNKGWYHKVIFFEGRFVCKKLKEGGLTDFVPHENLEVIGNIHENSELLK